MPSSSAVDAASRTRRGRASIRSVPARSLASYEGSMETPCESTPSKSVSAMSPAVVPARSAGMPQAVSTRRICSRTCSAAALTTCPSLLPCTACLLGTCARCFHDAPGPGAGSIPFAIDQAMARLPQVKLHGHPGPFAVLFTDGAQDRRMLVRHALGALSRTGARQAERQAHETADGFVNGFQHAQVIVVAGG